MTAAVSEALFSDLGRRLPTEGMRVFSSTGQRYYKLQPATANLDAAFDRSVEHLFGGAAPAGRDVFKAACAGVLQQIQDDGRLNGLLNGPHFPFLCPPSDGTDMGGEFENRFLRAVDASFRMAYPDLHFKATVQGEVGLGGHVTPADGSRYDRFAAARASAAVAGWYFPAALQEYDIASQRAQMASLPWADCLVLSGGFEAASALVGTPSLLVNETDYAPVLCLSGMQHSDERLMMCFKAYGLSLEFWTLSQMLTPTITQVSEQWAGGLTCFTAVD